MTVETVAEFARVLQDFEKLCARLGIKVLERSVVDHKHRYRLGGKLLPNLLGEIAIYRVVLEGRG